MCTSCCSLLNSHDISSIFTRRNCSVTNRSTAYSNTVIYLMVNKLLCLSLSISLFLLLLLLLLLLLRLWAEDNQGTSGKQGTRRRRVRQTRGCHLCWLSVLRARSKPWTTCGGGSQNFKRAFLNSHLSFVLAPTPPPPPPPPPSSPPPH